MTINPTMRPNHPEREYVRNSIGSGEIKNKSIKIPIAGTLDHPKLDQKALSDAMAQFMRDAANGAVRDGLQRGLDKLLAPINPK